MIWNIHFFPNFFNCWDTHHIANVKTSAYSQACTFLKLSCSCSPVSFFWCVSRPPFFELLRAQLRLENLEFPSDSQSSLRIFICPSQNHGMLPRVTQSEYRQTATTNGTRRHTLQHKVGPNGGDGFPRIISRLHSSPDPTTSREVARFILSQQNIAVANLK